MEYSQDHSFNTNGSDIETVTDLPPAVWEDCDSPQIAGYTCLSVDDEQYYYPNKLQVVLTLQWLTTNYEPCDGVSLPRCSIFKHYSDFCKKQDFQPVNAASFGKVIRQVFPELRTRRLGTRGQSKYHYYGIQVKTSSPYYRELAASQRQSFPTTSSLFNSPIGGAFQSFHTMFDAPVIKQEQPMAKPTKPQVPEDKVSDFLLPEFPDAEEIHLSDSTLIGKVDSFLETYRTHCQKLLNVLLNSKLDEVHFHIEKFWHELSGTSQQLLGMEKVALLVSVCDKLLYQTMMSMLMPGIIQHLLPSLLHAIRHFSCGFVKHLEGALVHQPSALVAKKMEVAKDFADLLKRKTSLSHLAQATCTVLRTDGSVKQMLHDWKKRTELTTVRSQLLWLVDDDEGPDCRTINKYLCEFVCLLDKHITVEDHLKWLQSVRKRCLSKYDDLPVEERCNHERRFMLQFCYISNLIIRDQTLRSATSFGSFHLLHLMYEEYLLYVLDVNKIQQHEKAMWKELHGTDSKVPENLLTAMGVASLDRFYGPVYKYQSHLASLYSKLDPKTGNTGSKTPTKANAQPLYHTPSSNVNQPQNVHMQQAWPSIHTNNSAQITFPVDLTTTLLHSPSSSAPAQTLNLSPQVLSALAAASPAPGPGIPVGNLSSQVASATAGMTTSAPGHSTPSPGGFESNEFAPIQYSPQMTLQNTQGLLSSPSFFMPSLPFSSPIPALSSHLNSSPLAASSPRQLHPHLGVSPHSMKTVSIGVPVSESEPVSEPLNLSHAATVKPHTISTAPLLSRTKFIATQVLKVSLVDGPKQSTTEGANTKITLSIPLAHGLNLSKGQVLKLSDGKTYNIEEVHTVLKETTNENIGNQSQYNTSTHQ